jgi:guanine deaminase
VDSTKALADEALRYKQRAFVGRVCMLQNSPDYYCNESEEQAQQADLAIVDYINKIDPQNEIVAPIITPRFAPSCSESHMCWQGKLAKDHNLMCQTHISENVSEVEWVKELYPKCKSYANVYDSTGLLTDRMILAHAVHLTEEEKNLIKDRNSGISHCPISNSALTSGQAPVRSFLDKNIKVGLGTDVAGGYSPSILEVARHASLVSRHVCMQTKKDRDILSLDEVFYLATLGGAKVCNLDKKLGNFEVGKQFDAQFVNLTVKDSPIDVFEWNMPKSMDEKLNHSLQRWLYQGDDRNTRQVWVGGGLVVNKD